MFTPKLIIEISKTKYCKLFNIFFIVYSLYNFLLFSEFPTTKSEYFNYNLYLLGIYLEYIFCTIFL